MATADLTVLALGRPQVSASEYIAEIQRRLAAILAADIAGYSGLMHEDEPATVRDLKAHQSAILSCMSGILSSATRTRTWRATPRPSNGASSRLRPARRSGSPTSISPLLTPGAGRTQRRRPRLRSS